jgi:hypothetical protein
MPLKVLIYAEQAKDYFDRLKRQFPDVNFSSAYSREEAPVSSQMWKSSSRLHVIRARADRARRNRSNGCSR